MAYQHGGAVNPVYGTISASGSNSVEEGISAALRRLDEATDNMMKTIDSLTAKAASLMRGPLNEKELPLETKTTGSSARMAIDDATTRITYQARKIAEIAALIDA